MNSVVHQRNVQEAREAGLAGKNMPDFGQLRDITEAQMRELNETYNEARNKHASKTNR